MGDSSAAIVDFHLYRPYFINAKWPPAKILNVKFSINNSQV